MEIPVSVKRARFLTIFVSIFWLGVGVVQLMAIGGLGDERIIGRLIVSILFLGNGLALAFSGFMLNNRKEIWFYLAFFVLATNIFFSVMDQIGFWDIATLLIDCSAMFFLIRSWGWFKPVSIEEESA